MHVGASLWRWGCEESRADSLLTAVDSLGEVSYLVSDSAMTDNIKHIHSIFPKVSYLIGSQPINLEPFAFK
jgi:hypothetical protein